MIAFIVEGAVTSVYYITNFLLNLTRFTSLTMGGTTFTAI